MSDRTPTTSAKVTECVTLDGSPTTVEVSVQPDGRITLHLAAEATGILTADQTARVRNHLGQAIADALRNAP